MDAGNFDEFTKRLARGASRRSLLKAVLGGAGAVMARAVGPRGAAALGLGDPCIVDVDDCEGDNVICASGSGEAGSEGTCVCQGDFDQCNDICIPNTQCCTVFDCTAAPIADCVDNTCIYTPPILGGECVIDGIACAGSHVICASGDEGTAGTCVCGSFNEIPTNQCNDICITSEQCCLSSECMAAPGGECIDNACVYPTTTTSEPTTTTSEPTGTIQVGEECVLDADCISGVCGCNSPFEFRDCVCREEECVETGGDCTGRGGAVACCTGDCATTSGIGTCIANVCDPPCTTGQVCILGSSCICDTGNVACGDICIPEGECCPATETCETTTTTTVEPTTTTTEPATTTTGEPATTTTGEPTTTTTTVESTTTTSGCLPDGSICSVGGQCCSGCCDESPIFGVPPNTYCLPSELCECGVIGQECGLIVNGTTIPGSEQLDCCEGLLCCHADDDVAGIADERMICAECCADWHCDKGEQCCRGECIPTWACCTDHDCDACEECYQGECRLTGVPFGEICEHVVSAAEGDSEQGTCCDGLVCCDADKDGNRCFECCGDWDCPKGTECKHGVCQLECKHDKACPDGTCCCKSGHCSKHCCDKHERPPRPGGGPDVDTLPSTGVGESGSSAGWLGAAALGAAAAYLAGKTIRDGVSPATEGELEE